jgi:hypothetical protein
MEKLMKWLETGVAKNKITGHEVVFKKKFPSVMNPSNILNIYSVYVEHVSLGQTELHVVIGDSEIVIQHDGKTIKRINAMQSLAV